MAWHRSNEPSKRLDEILGVGPALTTALVASIADPRAFRSGRDFSAWIGLVPKQNSSGGKERLGSITKRGDPLSAQPVHSGRAGGHSLREDPRHQAPAMAHRAVGTAANQGGRGRARQQDRPHGVGDDEQS